MNRPATRPGSPAQRSKRKSTRRGPFTREDWITLGVNMAYKGRAPTSVTLQQLCDAAKMTRGSFYSPSHFPGGMKEFRAEILARWMAKVNLEQLDKDMRAIQQSPSDRLRVLLERALDLPGGPVMIQQWAARDEAAEAARAAVEDAFLSHAAQALADLGEDPDKAGGLAYIAIRAVLPGPPPKADSVRGGFDALVDVVQRATAINSAFRFQAVPGSGFRVIVYTEPRGLSDDEQRELAHDVQALVDRRTRDSAGGEVLQAERAG